MTEAERILWARIRGKQLGVYFRRQVPIGSYIVDFVSIKSGLVVEVDGGQHLTERGLIGDARREEFLRSKGLSTLRFTNAEVLNETDGVVERIWNFVHKEE